MLFLCLSSTQEGKQEVPNSKYLDELLEKISMEDKSALADLYNETSKGVYAFALSILKNTVDAEDVLQDCFMSIYSNAVRYNSKGKPMAWILTITKNLCFDKMRKQKRFADDEIKDFGEQLDENESIRTEDKMVLKALIKHLSDEERNIVVLHAVSGFKHREIAEILDMRLSTVLSKYRRSINKLKELSARGEFLL